MLGGYQWLSAGSGKRLKAELCSKPAAWHQRLLEKVLQLYKTHTLPEVSDIFRVEIADQIQNMEKRIVHVVQAQTRRKLRPGS